MRSSLRFPVLFIVLMLIAISSVNDQTISSVIMPLYTCS